VPEAPAARPSRPRALEPRRPRQLRASPARGYRAGRSRRSRFRAALRPRGGRSRRGDAPAADPGRRSTLRSCERQVERVVLPASSRDRLRRVRGRAARGVPARGRGATRRTRNARAEASAAPEAAVRVAGALDALLDRPEEVVLAVSHALPVRYVVDASDGSFPTARHHTRAAQPRPSFLDTDAVRLAARRCARGSLLRVRRPRRLGTIPSWSLASGSRRTSRERVDRARRGRDVPRLRRGRLDVPLACAPRGSLRRPRDARPPRAARRRCRRRRRALRRGVRRGESCMPSLPRRRPSSGSVATP
jgi:hypothetical protein